MSNLQHHKAFVGRPNISFNREELEQSARLQGIAEGLIEEMDNNQLMQRIAILTCNEKYNK